MALVNTTDVIDNSIFLKAKLDKNMVGSNYYIENLQHKRNLDWNMRYNVVDIEEELKKQCEYTDLTPQYSPIDVVIRDVKSEKGQDLGSDWADIAFRDLKHPNFLGGRYRFSSEFPDMSNMLEEEKHFKTSVWICINKTDFKAGNSCIIRRCNANIALCGSPTGSNDYVTEIHYEPIILENDLKYINTYYNQTVPVPQAEWYATMQMNYFTNSIGLNDRFILGGTDLQNRSNNATFKVKAIVKSTSERTFAPQGSAEIENIPLIIIALDKDMIDEADDFYTRVANQAPIYLVKEEAPAYEYYIEMQEPCEQRILLGQREQYRVDLYWNQKIKESKFVFEAKLVGVDSEKESEYYKFEVLDDNNFAITNKKACNSGKLIVTCSCYLPVSPSSFEERKVAIQSYEIELGGFY